MQHFIDTATQRIWAFEENVVATLADGVYTFAYPSDPGDGSAAMIPIDAPATLQPVEIRTPTAEELAQEQIARAKALVKAEIRKKRDALLLLTPFHGQLFQTDLASKIQIMNVVDAGAMPTYARYWRTADNSYMEMTFDLFVELKAAIMAREGAAYGASAQHQDAVDALATLADVQTYDYGAGWPA